MSVLGMEKAESGVKEASVSVLNSSQTKSTEEEPSSDSSHSDVTLTATESVEVSEPKKDVASDTMKTDPQNQDGNGQKLLDSKQLKDLELEQLQLPKIEEQKNVPVALEQSGSHDLPEATENKIVDILTGNEANRESDGSEEHVSDSAVVERDVATAADGHEVSPIQKQNIPGELHEEDDNEENSTKAGKADELLTPSRL